VVLVACAFIVLGPLLYAVVSWRVRRDPDFLDRRGSG
jgi:hypothetical protein